MTPARVYAESTHENEEKLRRAPLTYLCEKLQSMYTGTCFVEPLLDNFSDAEASDVYDRFIQEYSNIEVVASLMLGIAFNQFFAPTEDFERDEWSSIDLPTLLTHMYALCIFLFMISLATGKSKFHPLHSKAMYSRCSCAIEHPTTAKNIKAYRVDSSDINSSYKPGNMDAVHYNPN